MSAVCCGALAAMNHGSTAMQWPPTPGPGLEDVDPRVAVGEADHLPHVEAEVGAHVGQLVGEGDVGVAEGVLGELGQLGHLGAAAVHLAAREGLVELGAAGGAGVREAADEALVFDDLAQDGAGQHALGGVGEEDVAAGDQAPALKIAAHDRGDEVSQGAGRDGGLEHDQRAGPEHRDDRAGGGLDEAEVGAVVRGDRCRYTDEIGARGDRGWHCAQGAGGDGGADEGVQLGLDDVDPPGVDRVEDVAAQVDAGDPLTPGGEHRGGRQTDVAEAQHAHVERRSFRGGERGQGHLRGMLSACCDAVHPAPHPDRVRHPPGGDQALAGLAGPAGAARLAGDAV